MIELLVIVVTILATSEVGSVSSINTHFDGSVREYVNVYSTMHHHSAQLTDCTVN